MNAQEKFLEFSLYNLSNFVATTTSDIIDIQGLPTLAWTTPLTTINYGTTPWLAAAQAPTASYGGSTLSSSTGNFTYTLEPPTVTTATTITPTYVLPVGTNEQICATWAPTSGNAIDYLAVTTPTCTTITVLPDTTTTTLATTSAVYYGQQPIALPTPQVTTGGPATLNEGTITVTLTGSVIGSVQVCTINLASPTTCAANLPATYDAGTYTLQACYTDTAGNFANSCSAATQIVINPDPTTTTVVVTPTPAPVNTTVTLTATVSDTYYPTPAGSITFYDGTNLLSTVALNGTTSATFTTNSLIVGIHSISACYVPSVDPSGTYDFLTSCSAAAPLQVVVPPPALGTVTVLNSSDNPSIVGTQVTFSAAVATTGSFPSVPAGTMNFFDGTTLLNPTPIALDVNGYGTFTTSTLTVGTHPITAVFLGGTAGSNTYAGSTSTVLNQVVTTSLTSAGNGFLMVVNPTAISVGVGNSATVNVSIAALNNFNQTVQLSCTGMPAESTCSFAQSLIPVGGGTTTLTVNVAAPHACGTGAPYFVATSGMGTTLPLVALSALGLFFIRKRKRLFQGMTLALALCLLPVLNGCATNCTDFGTQPGTYTFTVTATAGGAIAPSTTPQVSTQTVQMIVHL